MKFIQLSIAIIIVLSLSYFSGCKKKTNDPINYVDINIMKENALLSATFDDIVKVTENILMNNGDAKINTLAAPLGCITNIDTVVKSPTSKLYTVVFDSLCTSYDGKTRNGTMYILLNGVNYQDAGSVTTVTFNNFSVNVNPITGKLVVTNEGNNTRKIEVSDTSGTGYANMFFTGGGINIQWKSTHRSVLYYGMNDKIIINNKYKILQHDLNIPTYSGISSDNQYYTGNPTPYLILNDSCPGYGNLRYPNYGQILYNWGGHNYFTADYGDGIDSTGCTASVTLTIGATSQVYNLW
ncbi:MAG TPA: hypothetical protein VK766_07305 [Cytophagaceae bacterium]|jgi:hypothetical protein|nr:hypothetical protein [Cytophagaceae bacterium]